MAMKCCIVKAAAANGTPPYTQNITNSAVFGGATPKLAILLSGGTGSEDAATDGAKFCFGAGDGTNYAAIAWAGDTLANPNGVGRSNRSNAAYVRVDKDGAVVGVATLSLIADGAQLTWSDQSEGEDLYVLLLGGDVEAAVSHLTSNNGTSAQSVTHGLAAAPELIVAFGIFSADNTDGGSDAVPGIGFWTAAGQVGYSHRERDNLATVATSGRISSTQALCAMGTGNTHTYAAAISNVGASTFDITFSGATTNRVHFIALRSTSGTALAVAAGTATAKTTTGTQVDVSGMSLDAQVLIVLPTACTAVDDGSGSSSTDPGGVFGVGLACKRSSDGTAEYASVVSAADDGVATSDDWLNHQRSSAKHLHQVNTAGATAVAATVSSWSGGIEHDYGTASGTAIKFPYLAFGADVVAVGHPASRRRGRAIIGVEGVRIH